MSEPAGNNATTCDCPPRVWRCSGMKMILFAFLLGEELFSPTSIRGAETRSLFRCTTPSPGSSPNPKIREDYANASTTPTGESSRSPLERTKCVPVAESFRPPTASRKPEVAPHDDEAEWFSGSNFAADSMLHTASSGGFPADARTQYKDGHGAGGPCPAAGRDDHLSLHGESGSRARITDDPDAHKRSDDFPMLLRTDEYTVTYADAFRHSADTIWRSDRDARTYPMAHNIAHLRRPENGENADGQDCSYSAFSSKKYQEENGLAEPAEEDAELEHRTSTHVRIVGHYEPPGLGRQDADASRRRRVRFSRLPAEDSKMPSLGLRGDAFTSTPPNEGVDGRRRILRV
ncbi:unnamed protein product [Amoebophrya sp. A25]|nr:unnamed protein product [Amoebophrya sp. A25]|eukprot:GSA25T00004525001.1